MPVLYFALMPVLYFVSYFAAEQVTRLVAESGITDVIGALRGSSLTHAQRRQSRNFLVR